MLIPRDLPSPLRARAFQATTRIIATVLRTTITHYFEVRTAGLDNLPPRGPAIVAGNHPSLLDGLLLYLLSPVRLRFMAHRELFRHPCIGWLMRGLGFINAGNRSQALRDAEQALRAGEVMVVFPEGAAYDRGRMEQLYPGVGVLAIRTAATILPLGIAGAAEAFPLGAWVPRPAAIALRVGRPVCYATAPLAPGAHIPERELTAALIDLRRRIVALRDEATRELDIPRPIKLMRRLEIIACGLLLIPLVVGLTVTAHELQPPRP